jgi:outer membrane protein assembly factor BamB
VSRAASRRAVLLGAAALLPGCESLEDLLGTRKDPLPGTRLPILAAETRLEADSGLAASPFALPEPAEIADWPLPGGPPTNNPPHAAIAGPLAEAWRANAGSGSGFRRRLVAGPVAAAGSVFVADAFGEVSAFDLARGGRRWSRDTRPEGERGPTQGAGVAFAEGTVFAATAMAELLALDAASGEVRWRVRLPSAARGAPTVLGGRVFVPVVEHQLLAYSAEDGRRLWVHRATPTAAVPFGLPTPAIARDTVIAGFPSGEVVALRAADGRVLWTESLGAPGGTGGFGELAGIRAMPVVAGGLVYLSSLGGLSACVDLRSGRRVWEREIGGGATPAVSGDWAFLVSEDGQAIALGREDGRIRWITELNAAPEGRPRPVTRWGSPLLLAGRVFIPGSDSQGVLLNAADGGRLGTVRLSGGVTLPAAIAGAQVLVLSDDGWLAALSG